jgi:S-adenosylmethionine synthetase
LDIFVDKISELSASIHKANQSSELIFKQVAFGLEESNQSIKKQAALFEDISKKLQELNTSQFSGTESMISSIDKVADAISDAVLDLVMSKKDSGLRCACETLVTTNRVIVAGEYKAVLSPEQVDSAVRQVIKDIGYEQTGFDWRTVEITNLLHAQSADIALGTDSFGAGDQGLMFGYACGTVDTDYMPEAIYYSHALLRRLTEVRKNGILPWLGPDAKAQVTIEYDDDSKMIRFAKIVLSTQHQDKMDLETIRAHIQALIQGVLPSEYLIDTEYYINPTGRFVIGGPDGDCGLTGRKIIVDTYGGYSAHGGGAFSGKDPTKVDRSAAYMMRYLAKNIVASGQATWATCQISYAIGLSQPMSFYVESDGDSRALTEWVNNNVDLTPMGIIKRFDLFRPIYSDTTNYGHFGKATLPWEQVDLF